MRKARQDDLKEFEALYDKYSDRIYRFCYRLSGSAADAEDLVQDVFIAAYQGQEKFEGRSSIATWLYRVALYKWRRMSQSRERQHVPLSEEISEPVTDMNDPARTGVERMSLEQAIGVLPVDLREAFVLVKAEGLKYREAAIALNVPQGTVQRRVHDAVHRLRALLADEAGDAVPAPSTSSEVVTRTKGGDQECVVLM
jgi:RNA polymerase sigma-70 factor (ECF subfamily)